MKITDKTRIKVKSKLCAELGFYLWDRWKLSEYLSKNYDFEYTSRRWNILYFRPKDINKATLFVLKYGEFVK